MKIGISADSICDLTPELLEKYDVHIMPMVIMLDDQEYEDGININQDQLFEFTEKTGRLPKTSARSSYEYIEHFEKLLQEYDHIIHFSISFKISSTGNNAVVASKEIGDNKVTVIDTKSLTTGAGFLTISCAEKIKAGENLEDIVAELEQEKEKIQASFLVDTLKFLHKGGRCSSLALLGANLLKIKPRISLVAGEMKVTKKYIGNIEVSLIKYMNDLLKECPPNKKRAFITYSSFMPVANEIEQKLKEFGFKEVIQTFAGPTVCTHCGKKTLGIIYEKE
ncbi:MAG: DegV family protein [Eubacteriales bacterium]|nr:DegV family protein [Eubacteriales bacterium]